MTEAELARYMDTPAFRLRVEAARERYADAVPDFRVLAVELQIPVEILIRTFAASAAETPCRASTGESATSAADFPS